MQNAIVRGTMWARRILFLCALTALGAHATRADAVSEPKRLFGLGDLQLVTTSPDNRFVATAGQGGAFLWDFQTGALLHRLNVGWSVSALAFSPDGNTLLGATRNTIIAWNTDSGRRENEYVGHVGGVSWLQVAPDGETFVSASSDNNAHIWSFATGEIIHSVKTPGAPITLAAISPDGQQLITVDASPENSVKIWDIESETMLRFLPKTNWAPSRVVFTTNGLLATSPGDRTVTLWNTETAQLIRSFGGISTETLYIHDIWTPDAATLAAACNDGRIFRWNLGTGTNLGFTPGEQTITAAGVPNASQALVVPIDFSLRLREVPSGTTIRTFSGHTASTHSAVAFSPDGRYVLSGGSEAATRLWNRRTGEPVRNFMGLGSGTMAGAFSADGSNVLTTIGLPNPAAQLWKTETGELIREFKWSGSWPMSATISKDGTRIATGAQDGRIRIFDAATGGLNRTLTSSGWIRPVAFSPSAPLIAAGSSDSSVALFNHQTGQRLHTFSVEAGPVVAASFSPNGDTLLVAWGDGVIHLYNTFTLDLRREFFGAPAFLESAAWSPDGQYILTGEGWPLFTATLWDAKTAEPLRTFEGHQWVVGAVAFNPTGASILTGAELVREWSIADLAARLRFEKVPQQIKMSWALGQLQRAPSPAGPWETLPNATSPFSAALEEPAGFFRINAGEVE